MFGNQEREFMDKLTIQNMELYYGDFKALKGINLNIQANEITAYWAFRMRKIDTFKVFKQDE